MAYLLVALPVAVPSQLNRDDELEGPVMEAGRRETLSLHHIMKSLILAQDERWRRA